MRLVGRALRNFSVRKTYYPLFLSPDYQLMEYSQAYAYQADRLKIENPNIYQVGYDTLPKFLSTQIKEDKYKFLKPKEMIFIGRSNSGKSSLINSIFKDKSIARKAKAPGTTKFLHFHKIAGSDTYIVDAPGYGFAQMNKRRRNLWFGLVESYIKISSRISQIFVCINFEHGLQKTDIEALKRLSKMNIDIQIIMNKIDKIHEKNFMNQVKAINDEIRRLELPNINNKIIACSPKSMFGLQAMRCMVIEAMEQSKQRNIDQNQDLLLEYLKQFRVSEVQLQSSHKKLSRPHIVRKLVYNSKLTKYLL